MPSAMEQKLDKLVNEIAGLQKYIILQKSERANLVPSKMTRWKLLSHKVSEKWDHVSAVDEIRRQRTKA
jgi:hypothetical protein